MVPDEEGAASDAARAGADERRDEQDAEDARHAEPGHHRDRHSEAPAHRGDNNIAATTLPSPQFLEGPRQIRYGEKAHLMASCRLTQNG